MMHGETNTKNELSCLKPQTLFTSPLKFLARGSLSNNNSNNKYDKDDHDTDSRRNINGIRRIHNGTLTGLVTPCVKTAFENTLMKER